eukprot:m.169092 g.169092  ORF g.169092 m.169092 type:complete len:1543 (-) comp13473_c2_seq4:187-4815(-)
MPSYRHVVRREANNVISAMRQNSRWAPDPSQAVDPMLMSFIVLKEELCKPGELPVDMLVNPFLDVIKSDSTTGAITSVALHCIHNFILQGLIKLDSPHASQGVNSMAHSVTHTKFVETDRQSDEVVLLRIIQVLEDLLCSVCGELLCNDSVREMLQACFRISFEQHLSEVLRHYASVSFGRMIHHLFSRLPLLNQDNAMADLLNVSAIERTDVPLLSDQSSVLSLQVNVENKGEGEKGNNSNIEENDQHQQSQIHTKGEHGNDSPNESGNPKDNDTLTPINSSRQEFESLKNSRGVTFQVVDESASGAGIPYDLSTLCELLRFISNLIDPFDGRNTVSQLSLGLSMVIVVFETTVKSLDEHPSLFQIVEDSLCFHLFELLDHKSFEVFSAALHALSLLMETQRQSLKFQLEKLLLKLIYLQPETYEHEEAVVEYILQFTRQKEFIHDLMIHFDCNLYCDDLVLPLLNFLRANVETETLYSTSFLALEALLYITETVVQETSGERGVGGIDAVHALREKKAKLSDAIQKFNEKPKKGIQQLADVELIQSATSYGEIAQLLRASAKFDKTKLGEYIGKDTNVEVLQAYIDTFDFTGQTIDDSLRSLLTSFRLPGESQVIERILTAFSQRFMSTAPSDIFIRSEDAALVLTYAIVMLNVDQHSPKVAKRMTVNDFVKNLRGANENENFDRDELERIFNHIKDHEIVLPDEHAGKVSSQMSMWEVLVERSRIPTSKMEHHPPSFGYNHAIFEQISTPLTSALIHVLQSSDDKKILNKVEVGLNLLCDASAKFHQIDTLDTVFDVVSSETIICDYEGQQLSATALQSFLKRRRAQMCLKMVFDLCRKYGNYTLYGWRVTLFLVHVLVSNRILPRSMSSVVDFVREGGRFHYFTLRSHDHAASKADSSVFFLSSFSSLFSSSTTTSQPSAVESLRGAVRETIDDFQLDRLFHEATSKLSDDELHHLLVLLSHFARGPAMISTTAPMEPNKPDSTNPNPLRSVSQTSDSDVKQTPSQTPSSNPTTPAKTTSAPSSSPITSSSPLAVSTPALKVNKLVPDEFLNGLQYNQDCAVFFLELLTDVAILNNKRVASFWDDLTDHFFRLLSVERGNHYLMERVVVSLLRIAQHFLTNTQLQRQVLELLRLLADVSLQSDSLAQISSGLCDLIQARHMSLDECEGWDVVCYLLRGCVADVKAAFPALKAASFIAPCLTQASAPHLAQLLLRFTNTPATLALYAHNNNNAMTNPSSPSTGGAPLPLGVSLLRLAEGVLHRSIVVFDRDVNMDMLWTYVWEPLLQAMAHSATCVDIGVRQTARESINHCLFDPITENMTTEHWGLCFKNVLVPFMFRLVNTPVKAEDYEAMMELRDGYCLLFSRVFRRRLQQLQQLPDFPQIWINVLTIFNSLYSMNHVDSVRESLKIVILLMAREGLFERDPEGNMLWAQTLSRVNAFLPGFHKTLYESGMQPPKLTHQQHTVNGSGVSARVEEHGANSQLPNSPQEEVDMRQNTSVHEKDTESTEDSYNLNPLADLPNLQIVSNVQQPQPQQLYQ